MYVRPCGNVWWSRAAVHGATVPLLDAFLLLFVLYLFSCNILLISDLSAVFLKYRKLVNSFHICETCFIIWRHLFTVALVFHSLDWSALVLPDPHPSIIFSEVLDCLIASHYVDLEIKRIVSFRSQTGIKTTNSDLTCQLLAKSISDTLFSNLNRFPLCSLSNSYFPLWLVAQYVVQYYCDFCLPHWIVSSLRAGTVTADPAFMSPVLSTYLLKKWKVNFKVCVKTSSDF